MQVSVSKSFVCGLRADGSPDCFGDTARLWTTLSERAVVSAEGEVVAYIPKAPPPAAAVMIEISSHYDGVCVVYIPNADAEAGAAEPVVDCWDPSGRMDAPQGIKPAAL